MTKSTEGAILQRDGRDLCCYYPDTYRYRYA
jgi:hypothetical protein